MNNLEKELASIRELLQEKPVILQNINDLENSSQVRSLLGNNVTSQSMTLKVKSSAASAQSRTIFNGDFNGDDSSLVDANDEMITEYYENDTFVMMMVHQPIVVINQYFCVHFISISWLLGLVVFFLQVA